MKRTLFIASVVSVVAAFPPLFAKARGPARRDLIVANVQAPGWRKPSWCCGSAVVWLDIPHGVYYRKGQSRYGRTERGAYTCEDYAAKAGNRAG